MNYKQGKELIEKKVEDFSNNKEEYLSHSFHEASARSRFIDPFFQALGWDFEQTNLKPHLWDVMREYSDHTTTKRPDYAFRINGELKFFVEAKAPWVPLTKKEPVFQAKRYAFSTNGKAPIVVLTDFEEFRVFNALKKPDINLPLEGVLKEYDLTSEKYLDKWDLLYGHFSREAVADGALEELKGKLTKKTKTLDQEFLEEITHWREMLAKSLAIRNSELTVDELNVSVQRILDRLIFIRNLEDRHIEQEGKLLSLAVTKPCEGSEPPQGCIYENLVPYFRKLDSEYNGLLFKQHFSEKLTVDDKVLTHIIKHLSFPLSPYQFDVIEPEILGRIYEKFLGSKIRLTAGHHAKIEEKPEVRKAGGVYYTPQYIVDYIVKNTVGEKIKGKTPEKITEIKIVDPACGSGSFLLGAFEYLMNYHLEWYGKNRQKRKYKDDWYLTADSDIRLSVAKKADILKNNIFGVDIDREATEVAIMSLYLKLLDEGFDKGQAMLFMKGHILPDMTHNIKCGNSLIGSDYFEGQNIAIFDNDEAKKVNAFDWDVEFPEAFANGGFDCVIGNPPYIQLSMMEYFNEKVNKYLVNQFSSSMGRNNTFGFFIEHGISKILNKGGLFSFIVPNTLLTQEYYVGLRECVLTQKIVNLTSFKNLVFKDAVVEAIVFVIKLISPNKRTKIELVDFDNKNMTSSAKLIKQFVFETTHKKSFLVNLDEDKIYLKKKFEKGNVQLSELVNINQAIALKHDRSKWLFKEKLDSNYKPILDGRNINRYSLSWDGHYLKYDLSAIHSCKRNDIFEIDEKIFFRRVGSSLVATFDNLKYYALNTLVVITFKNLRALNIKYILGLINSSAMNFYYLNYLKSTKKVFSEIQARQLAQIPIRQIDFNNKKEKSRHDQMLAYVETMLELNKKLPKLKTEHEKTVIQRQIDATDRKIDKLVYKLYDLTDNEITIVEESVTH